MVKMACHGGSNGFARWRKLFAPILGVAPAADGPAQDIRAGATVVSLGIALLIELQTTVAEIYAPESSAGGLDHVLVWFCRAGTMAGRTSAGSLALAAGDIVILDLLAPFTFEVSDHAASILVVPRDLALARGWAVPHGRRFSADSPLTTLLSAHLDVLDKDRSTMTSGELAVGVASLVALVAAEAPGPDLASPRARVLASMARDLPDTGLTPARIAAECGSSRMSVYRALSPEGGVTAVLLRLRLERALMLLLVPAQDASTIAAISLAVGFASQAHFARSFRQCFGMTPRALRRGNTPPPDRSFDGRLQQWMDAAVAFATTADRCDFNNLK